MPSDQLRQAIREYVIREYLEEGDERVIADETPLITSGIVDSFSMVSLKVFLEKKYAIRIPDELATPAAFDTVARIAELVTQVRQAAPKAAVS